METTTKETKHTDVRRILEPVILNISWAEISRDYFGKSRAWLYQKFTGYNGHDNTDFTESERETMKNAMFDLSDRIRKVAEKL